MAQKAEKFAVPLSDEKLRALNTVPARSSAFRAKVRNHRAIRLSVLVNRKSDCTMTLAIKATTSIHFGSVQVQLMEVSNCGTI
jgi:hypothetical protein